MSLTNAYAHETIVASLATNISITFKSFLMLVHFVCVCDKNIYHEIHLVNNFS